MLVKERRRSLKHKIFLQSVVHINKRTQSNGKPNKFDNRLKFYIELQIKSIKLMMEASLKDKLNISTFDDHWSESLIFCIFISLQFVSAELYEEEMRKRLVVKQRIAFFLI